MRVAVSSLSFSNSPLLMSELSAAGFSPTPNRAGKVLQGQALAAFLAGHEAAIVGTELIDGAVLDSCPDLKVVAKYGVGLDNVDERELARRGIRLGVAAGVNRRSVAELVLAFLLGHSRNVFASVASMRQGMWQKAGGRELSSMTVGLVGFGHTGSEVARLLAPFGTTVLYHDVVDKTTEAKSVGAVSASYADLLARADAVSFHVPGGAATNRMLGSSEIATMRPHALVINTSRGSVVDFDAATNAVIGGRLGGFAADVFPVEPDDLSRFRDQPNLYFTPHIGGNSQEAVLAMGRAAIQQLLR